MFCVFFPPQDSALLIPCMICPDEKPFNSFTLYLPGGIKTEKPVSIALWIDKVSSVTPSPLAPNHLTLSGKLFASVWACKSFNSLRITCGIFSNNNLVKSSILLFTSWAKSVTVELSDINVRLLLTITCSLSSLRRIKFASITPAFVISVGITKTNSPLVKFSGGIITKPELLLLVYWYVSFNEWPVKSISVPLSTILINNVLALTSPCIICIGWGKSLLTVSHKIVLFLKLSKLIKKYHYC